MKIHNRSKGLRFGIVFTLLIAGVLFFFQGEKAYAMTAQDTVTATAESSDNNLTGSLGPLEFTLNTDEDAQGLSSTLQILLVLTVISLAPSILIMVTSFTRIIVVLHFTRAALGTQTTPPNQVLVSLALFLTMFIMNPVFTQINEEAVKPLTAGTITREEALDAGLAPIRSFMIDQVLENPKDLRLFMDIAKIESVKTWDDLPITVIIPAFIIGELRRAFIIGFIIYIPFIVIDMVVASTLMSMGMMMLPPSMISMPFKILLFVIADGWNLVIGQLVQTFYR
ncbi:flagellar biosynthetic protein FliP [Anaerotaenia torta]|uniref:flagellar type III secretion system pore protein FliP n=1 Tax=Anaerotaenia torta TaxID=433293 RepID=UPI003D1F7521